MKKVVWLASWYPSESDAFTGDFIQRHARATALFQPIDLLFIGKTKRSPVVSPGNSGDTEGLRENILYYNGNKQPGIRASVIAFRDYWLLFQRWFGNYRALNGLPDLVHVHVVMRAGLMALYLKKRYGIPYVLTEHWTAYYNDSTDPIAKRSRLFHWVVKQILRQAAVITPVSRDLGRQMTEMFGTMPIRVVSNVVDTRLFFLKKTGQEPFRFIHVSAMTKVKNPAGILRAFSALLGSGAAAELVMIGPRGGWEDMGDREVSVRFTGEIPYDQVAREMRKASAFVLFSQRENQPCVLLEALCCGLPVIATRTGGIPELIDEANGVLVDAGDEQALTAAMAHMILNHSAYDAAAISERAMKKFSYGTVGAQFAALYGEIF